jgi:hypothetical protein
MFPSPTDTRKKSSLQCTARDLCLHEYLYIKNIEKELNSLEALYESMDNADLNTETKLLTLKNELKSYFEKKTEGAVIRSYKFSCSLNPSLN